VDGDDEPTEREGNGEGGDLSTEDRRSIDRHLEACPACRQYRVALEQALGALAHAAASLPILADAPSLWPLLERRIQADPARTGSRWSRAVHGVTERGLRAWADLGGERPLQWAWIGDSLSEVLAGRGRSVREPRRRPGLVLLSAAAAAILTVVIVIPTARRQQADAQSTIRANAAPLAGRVFLPVLHEPEAPATSEPADDRDIATNQLAQAEPVPTAETPAPGLDGGSASKAVATSRYGYDLEHGIPMPPDARDSKPVY